MNHVHKGMGMGVYGTKCTCIIYVYTSRALNLYIGTFMSVLDVGMRLLYEIRKSGFLEGIHALKDLCTLF